MKHNFNAGPCVLPREAVEAGALFIVSPGQRLIMEKIIIQTLDQQKNSYG